MEVEDDWNPNPDAKTVFDKVILNYSNKIIKENIIRMEKEEEETISKYGNMTCQDFIDKKKKTKKYNNKKKAKATTTTTTVVTTTSNIKEVPDLDMDSNNEDMDEDDDDDNIMFDIKNVIKGEKLLGENLYDPLQDNKIERWVKNHLRLDKSTPGIILSCPSCFIQVCYDSQRFMIAYLIQIKYLSRHEKYEHQYRAIMVYNCKIDCTRSLKFSDDITPIKGGDRIRQKYRRVIEGYKSKPLDKDMQSEHNHENNISDNEEQLGYDIEYEDIQSKDYELFFPLLCKECSHQIGVYDVEAKIYHLFDVLAGIQQNPMQYNVRVMLCNMRLRLSEQFLEMLV